MKASARKALLLLALAGVAALFVFDPVPRGNAFVQPSSANVSPSDGASTGTPDVLTVAQPAAPIAATDPIQPIRPRGQTSRPSPDFARKDWTPPPVLMPMPTPPPPAPQAPPLPFRFLGKQLAGGTWTVFLSYQGETTVVQEGQQLGSTYRVTQIKPPSMAVVYLPLNQTQYLPIGQAE